MITFEDSLFDHELIVVEELFEKSRLAILIELHGQGATFREGMACLALRIYHDRTALVCLAILLLDHRIELREQVLLGLSRARLNHDLVISVRTSHLMRSDGDLDLAIAMVDFLRVHVLLLVALVALLLCSFTQLF